MASRFSIEAVFKAIDNFTAPLSKMTRSTKTFTQSLKTDFAKAQRQVIGIGNGIKRYAGLGIVAIGAAFGLAAKEGIELASNLLEVQNVVDTTFGDNSKKIDDWSKSAITNFGLSELQAKNFTSTLGSMAKSSGLLPDQILLLSTSLTGLSGDYASFRNLKPEEAFEKMKSIITGETEPLRSLGFNMTVANLQAFALTQGINKQWKQMSQAEQVMLRYNYIMANSKDAQGDFAKTLKESLANQLRVLKTNFDQKLAASFEKLIPHLIELLDKLNTWLSTVDTDKVSTFIENLFIGIENAGKAIWTFIQVLQFITPVLIPIIAAIAIYKIALFALAVVQAICAVTSNAMLLPIYLIIAAIGILVAIIIWVVQNWNKLIKVMQVIWGIISWIAKLIWDGLVKALQAAGSWLSSIWDGIVEKMQPIINIFKFLIDLVAIGLKAAFDGVWNFIKPIIEGIGDFFSGVFNFFGKLGKGVADFVTGGPEKTKPIPIQAPANPYERAIVSSSKEEKITRGEVTIKDQTGKAAVTKKPEKGGYNIKLQPSGAFY